MLATALLTAPRLAVADLACGMFYRRQVSHRQASLFKLLDLLRNDQIDVLEFRGKIVVATNLKPR